MANIKLIAGASSVILYLWEEFALGVSMQIEFTFYLLANVLAPGVNFEVDLHIDINIYLQILLLRHHFAQFFRFFIRRFLLTNVQISMRLLFKKR